MTTPTAGKSDDHDHRDQPGQGEVDPPRRPPLDVANPRSKLTSMNSLNRMASNQDSPGHSGDQRGSVATIPAVFPRMYESGLLCSRPPTWNFE